VNEESQQSRACGAPYFVGAFFAHGLMANDTETNERESNCPEAVSFSSLRFKV
jgi:hypothetical protein